MLLPHGAAHVLHDGSGQTPIRTQEHRGSAGWMLSENDGEGDHLDMLCGRFFIAPPHDRLIRNYMPANLVVRAMDGDGEEGIGSASNHLANLVGLMRMESAGDKREDGHSQRTFLGAIHTGIARGKRSRSSSRRIVGGGRPSTAGPGNCGDVGRSDPVLETA